MAVVIAPTRVPGCPLLLERSLPSSEDNEARALDLPQTLCRKASACGSELEELKSCAWIWFPLAQSSSFGGLWVLSCSRVDLG